MFVVDATFDVIVTVPVPDVVMTAQPVAITATASSPAARTALLPGRDFIGLPDCFLDCVAQNYMVCPVPSQVDPLRGAQRDHTILLVATHTDESWPVNVTMSPEGTLRESTSMQA